MSPVNRRAPAKPVILCRRRQLDEMTPAFSRRTNNYDTVASFSMSTTLQVTIERHNTHIVYHISFLLS